MPRTADILASLSDEELTEVAHRLIAKLDLPRHADGTIDRNAPWRWAEYIDGSGYPRISIKGTKVGAHQLAFFLVNGYLAPVTRHSTPDPSNVNPFMLRGGTQADNMRDRDKRDGNTPKGVRNGRAKLDPAQVRAIRSEADRGATPQELAGRYGVSRANVHDIIRRRIWKHVV